MSLLFAFDYMTNIRRLTTTRKDFRWTTAKLVELTFFANLVQLG